MSAKDRKSGLFIYFSKVKGEFLTRNEARNQGGRIPLFPPLEKCVEHS